LQRKILVGTLLLAASSIAQAQQNVVTVIPKSQILQGLNLPTTSIDRTLRVVDAGSGQLGIAVAKHEANKGKPSVATGRTPKSVNCGVLTAPAGGKTGPGDGIWHDNVTEMYVILKGTGTLVTGGTIINGFRSSPDSDTDKIQTGTSCIGQMVGNVVRQKVSEGDVVVIPPGVPHGWEDLEAEISYLDVRTDPKKILQHGYVNPAIK
jgi:mannose-6-phosphate isomerase-like protein (cupin superfamily)